MLEPAHGRSGHGAAGGVTYHFEGGRGAGLPTLLERQGAAGARPTLAEPPRPVPRGPAERANVGRVAVSCLSFVTARVEAAAACSRQPPDAVVVPPDRTSPEKRAIMVESTMGKPQICVTSANMLHLQTPQILNCCQTDAS